MCGGAPNEIMCAIFRVLMEVSYLLLSSTTVRTYDLLSHICAVDNHANDLLRFCEMPALWMSRADHGSVS